LNTAPRATAARARAGVDIGIPIPKIGESDPWVAFRNDGSLLKMAEADTITIRRPEDLDADMTRTDLIEVLERLRFNNGHSVVRIDRDVRDFLVRLLEDDR
jgi:hypothetical protein